MSMSFDALVLDNVERFGILDTVRAMGLYGYTGRRARLYIERLKEQAAEEHTNERRSEVDKTVNTILLERGDSLITRAVREKSRQGYTITQIARYYNVFENQTPTTWGDIPDILYRALGYRLGEEIDLDDPPAWACGQDPERCESCGSLIGEDLRCPRCDAADELEDRLQAIVSEARETGGEL